MNKKYLQALCECGILVALAIVLSFLEIQLGASGGSINFTMLPLLIIAYRRGPVWAIGSGAVFGFIKCVIGGGVSYGLPSIILDYIVAYGLVGVAGLFMKNKKLIEVGSFVGCLLRYAVTVFSGIVLWAITEPTEVAGFGVFANPLIYSLVYNATYMVPSSIGCIVLMAALRPVLSRMDKMFSK